MKTNFTPIVQISLLSEKFAKKIGFEFTNYHLARTKEGWLILYVDWTAQGDWYYKTKYANDYGSMHSNREEIQELEFIQLPHKYYFSGKGRRTKLAISVGIRWDKGRRDLYRLSHYQNTKYGAVVYFSPRGFARKETVLTKWDNQEYWDKVKV